MFVKSLETGQFKIDNFKTLGLQHLEFLIPTALGLNLLF